jgi:hypothetical protein
MDPLNDMIRAIVRETIAELLPHLSGGDELLTLDAAGELVGKTPRAVRDAGRREEIEIVHVGRSPRVTRAALMAWARPVEVAAPKAAEPDHASSAVARAAARWSR